MSILMKGAIKKYGMLIVLFLCTLLIPSLLYSFGRDGYRPYRYPPLVKYSFKWPEEEHKTNDLHPLTKPEMLEREERLKEIDRRFCGRDRCRFVLPVVITEQESKAQLHFRQLAFLAGKVDRTIVLPNVHNSHLGACLAHPFDYYYDHSWLDRKKKHFSYITMDDFQAWLSARQEAQLTPVGQEIIIKGYNHHHHHKTSDLLASKTSHKKNCFSNAFDFSGRPAVTYQMRDSADASNFQEMTSSMKSLLSDEARQHEYIGQLGMLPSEDSFADASDNVKRKSDIPPVDVINLFYDRRFRFLDQQEAQAPLSYNQRWVDIAEEISSQLKPFLAIHWRMEQLEPTSNLLPCAKGLVKKVHRLKAFKDDEIKNPNVFLLTDYPHLLNTTGAKPESHSFKPADLTHHHHDAIHYLHSHLNITLTDLKNSKIHADELPKENWQLYTIKNHRVSPVDRSVLGIVDKLVAMRAQWFFAGKPRVCAKSSSFTGRIERNRAEAFENGDENIILPMDTFDIQH